MQTIDQIRKAEAAIADISRRDCAFDPLRLDNGGTFVDFPLGEIHISPTIEANLLGDEDDTERGGEVRAAKNSLARLIAQHAAGYHGLAGPGHPVHEVSKQSKKSGTGQVWSCVALSNDHALVILSTFDEDEARTMVGLANEMPSPSDLYGEGF
jgi:hypothetical protein